MGIRFIHFKTRFIDKENSNTEKGKNRKVNINIYKVSPRIGCWYVIIIKREVRKRRGIHFTSKGANEKRMENVKFLYGQNMFYRIRLDAGGIYLKRRSVVFFSALNCNRLFALYPIYQQDFSAYTQSTGKCV